MVVPHDGKAHVGQNLVGRRHTVSGPIPQLAVEIVSPGPQGPIAAHGSGGVGPGAHSRHVVQHLLGRGNAVQAPVPQLTVEIIPPRPQGPVGPDGGDVVVSRAHGGHLIQHLHRLGSGDNGPVPQLPIVVAAPGPEGPVGLEGHGEIAAGSHGAHVLQHSQRGPGDGHLVPLPVHAGLLGLGPQLPFLVAAPGPEGAVLVHIGRVRQARAQAVGLVRRRAVIGQGRGGQGQQQGQKRRSGEADLMGHRDHFLGVIL